MALASQVLTGCASMVPFTHEIRTEHDLAAEDLKGLQFYVSNDVVLRREAEVRGRTIDDGQLKLHAGKTIEEIVIAEHTPGVAVAMDATSITISFEEGSALDFSLKTGAPQPLRLEPDNGGFAEPPRSLPGRPSWPPPDRRARLRGRHRQLLARQRRRQPRRVRR